METHDYSQMWEKFGQTKAESYLSYKFQPTHRIGLTNYLREKALVELLDPKIQDIVLDVGCAAGRQLLEISNRIAQGVGTDISIAFIEKADTRAKEVGVTNLSFRQSKAEELPFPERFFDKVICAEVLEHVFKKDSALNEIKRVLKPGGYLIITVPNLNADGTLWGRLLRVLKFRSFQPLEQFSAEELAKHGDAHVREFSHKSLVSWLESNGFHVEGWRSVSFIDGPGFDFLLKIPLHWKPTQSLIIGMEKILSKTGLPWGRHLAVRAKLDFSPQNLQTS